jgi:hypothetical protein
MSRPFMLVQSFKIFIINLGEKIARQRNVFHVNILSQNEAVIYG